MFRREGRKGSGVEEKHDERKREKQRRRTGGMERKREEEKERWRVRGMESRRDGE